MADDTQPSAASTRSTLAHSVLTRYLPLLTRIIATASFCHLYRGLSGATFEWEKKPVAGSMFLVATAAPGGEDFHIVILNRKGPTNFVWTLASAEIITCEGRHLILSNTSGFASPASDERIDKDSCWGIWVYDNPGALDEKELMLERMRACAAAAERRAKDAGADVLGRLFENARARA